MPHGASCTVRAILPLRTGAVDAAVAAVARVHQGRAHAQCRRCALHRAAAGPRVPRAGVWRRPRTGAPAGAVARGHRARHNHQPAGRGAGAEGRARARRLPDQLLHCRPGGAARAAGDGGGDQDRAGAALPGRPAAPGRGGRRVVGARADGAKAAGGLPRRRAALDLPWGPQPRGRSARARPGRGRRAEPPRQPRAGRVCRRGGALGVRRAGIERGGDGAGCVHAAGGAGRGPQAGDVKGGGEGATVHRDAQRPHARPCVQPGAPGAQRAPHRGRLRLWVERPLQRPRPR
ncbi:MAG: hypothetical protein J3K34DRAFT_422751, partial [Monoraphidium minutum]